MPWRPFFIPKYQDVAMCDFYGNIDASLQLFLNSKLPDKRYHFIFHFLLVFLISFQSFFQDFLFVIHSDCNDWNIC